ncbi:MAG: redox-regulated ATPase YchF, partial [Candidatus Levybacteria bacterium]|nr:redox-regulated ATPase YchF [Candidatus Levybacteria bacterium]
QVGNYPFTTIEPNVGIVPVPDQRLEKLAQITKEEEKMGSLPPLKPATVEFVDIAGLVKGASEGAGLGNKFLSHIREVQIITHVVRAFADPLASSGQAPILREGAVDPKTDYETIEMELMLADLAAVQLQQSKMKRFQNQSEKDAVDKLFKALSAGIPARDVPLTEEEAAFAKTLFLLSGKLEIVVLNVSEADYTPAVIAKVMQDYSGMLNISLENIIVICAKVESELSELSLEEQKEYLADLGLEASGLERLIQKAYEQLGLLSFLTCGEKEVRAWTIKKGTNAQNAAGTIHNDFIKHFIKAEVVSFQDFISVGGWKKAREKGKARFEGKEYIVKDGDVIEFKIGQ